jgi:Acyl-CoA carboxylase epsilon subunit
MDERSATDEQPVPDEQLTAATPAGRRALFLVVRGKPTEMEVAALTVVLATTAGASNDPPQNMGGETWSDPAARLRGPLTVGPQAWRTSMWPR